MLRSGVKILISPHTPWNDLSTHGFGVIINIDNPKEWAEEINRDILTSPENRFFVKKNILNNILKHKLFKDVNVESIFDV